MAGFTNPEPMLTPSLPNDPANRTPRDRHWAGVLRVLAELPARQLRSALLLLHDLGMQFAPDGDPQAMLTRPQDWPLLDLPARLLAEWGDDRQCSAAAESLFVASALSFMAQALAASVSDPVSALRSEDSGLAAVLREHADEAWRALVATSSPFWEHHAARLAPPWTTGSLGGLALIAVALVSDRVAAIPHLVRFAAESDQVFSTLDELARLGHDLQNDARSSLATWVRAAGGRRHAPISLPVAVGTLLLSGKLAQILDELHRRISSARAEANVLQSVALAGYCDELQELVAQVGQRFGLRDLARPPVTDGHALAGFFKPATDLLAHTIASAKDFLLADLTLRDVWDCCRRPGHRFDVVVARAFPMSLVAEILIRQGQPMRETVDEILATLEASEYRYYADRREAIAPDADDLAFALRLLPYASNPGHHRESLQRPLRWMRENQRPDGQIPVWFRRNDGSPLADGVILYGSNCATVECNLLLGLIDFDRDGFASLINAAASSWTRRWLATGLGATGHYTPLYSVWSALELIHALRRQSIPDELGTALSNLEQRLCERLRREASRTACSPQDAAFMTLASLRCYGIAPDPGWIATMIKAQRPDGAWDGEGIYIVPGGRGLVTDWFRSRTITTAFIYHALCQYRAGREQG